MVQIMAWCWIGDKQLSELMMALLYWDICITWPQWVKEASRPLQFYVYSFQITTDTLRAVLSYQPNLASGSWFSGLKKSFLFQIYWAVKFYNLTSITQWDLKYLKKLLELILAQRSHRVPWNGIDVLQDILAMGCHGSKSTLDSNHIITNSDLSPMSSDGIHLSIISPKFLKSI